MTKETNVEENNEKIPKNIRYVSVGGTSEIRNLIKAIKIFNLDLSDLSTITFDMMYDRLTELSLEDVKEIFESNFIYYNLSNQIFTSGKNLFKTLIIPDTVIENRTDNTIKKSVLIDFVMDIKNLYARDIHQEEILTNILTNRKRLFKESSARDIFVTTVANIIANDDSFAEYLSNISIPNKLKEEAEISKLSYYSYTSLWNQEVINLGNMFEDCTQLKDLIINMDKFKTDNVTHMQKMFSNCNNLEQINIGKFNYSKVIFMNHMFENCEKLKEIDLSDLKLLNDKQVEINMYKIFYNLSDVSVKANNEIIDKFKTIFKNIKYIRL